MGHTHRHEKNRSRSSPGRGAGFAAPAHADFDNGGRFKTQTPPLLCEVGRDVLGTGADGVVCQGIFPQAPVEPCSTPTCPNPATTQDQTVVTSDGQFIYRDANIGIDDHPTLNTLTPGQSVTVRGWTITGTQDGVKISNAAGHGMLITAVPYGQTPTGQQLTAGNVEAF